MVRYCLCFVARSLASELAESQPVVFTPQLRRSLFDALSLCCEEGAQGGPPPGPSSNARLEGTSKHIMRRSFHYGVQPHRWLTL